MYLIDYFVRDNSRTLGELLELATPIREDVTILGRATINYDLKADFPGFRMTRNPLDSRRLRYVAMRLPECDLECRYAISYKRFLL